MERIQDITSESISLNFGAIIYKWCDLGKISKKMHIRFLICKMKVAISIMQDGYENKVKLNNIRKIPKVHSMQYSKDIDLSTALSVES